MWLPLAIFLVGLVVMALIEIKETKPPWRYPEASMLQPHRPFAVKAINFAGELLSKFGFRLPSLRPKDLVAAALHKAGLDEEPVACPEDESEYMAALRVLTDCLSHEASLTQLGRLVAHGTLVSSLANRYTLDHLYLRAKTGEDSITIKQQKVRGPLVILGLARTGTTFLHGLLAQDTKNFRTLKHWEMVNPPVPRKTDKNTDGKSDNDVEARRATAKYGLDTFLKLAPNFLAFHAIGIDLPEECVVIFQQECVAVSLGVCLNCPSYNRWLLQQDLGFALRRHRRVLGHYQAMDDYYNHDHDHGDAHNHKRNTNAHHHHKRNTNTHHHHKRNTNARQFVVKTPQYVNMLPELLREYPDAQIVWTHRTPSEVVVSYLSLATKLAGIVSDDVDPKRIAQAHLQVLNAGLAKALRDRRTLEKKGLGKSFCDVQFTQLCKDPMAVVRGIYRHFDKKLSPEAERQMETYLKNNKRFKHGKPLVDLEGTFGVTERDMKLNAFVDYTKAFVMQKQQQQPTSPGALGDEGESAVKG